MRIKIIRNVGLVSGVAALLLTSTVALAEVGKGNIVKEVKTIKIAESREATSTKNGSEKRDDKSVKKEEERAKVAKKVAEIQDKAKQELVAKLADKFEDTNKTWTDHFVQLLDRYDALLVKAQSKTNASSTAIESAKATIAKARMAVAAQVAKSYVPDTSKVTVTATTTAKGQGQLMKALQVSLRDMHKLLFRDLFALRDGVMKDAKSAVQNVVQSFAKSPKVERGNATSTDNS